jgi:uncharacterized membrane protein
MEYSKHRFEFFSDGVMAIIMTIMAIEVPVSHVFGFSELPDLLKAIFIFFASFFIVGYFWNRHHKLIDGLEALTSKIIWRNHLFLFLLALLPCFTKWIIEMPDKLLPVVAYDILYLLVNLSYLFIAKGVYEAARIDDQIINRIIIKLSAIHIIIHGILVLLMVILQLRWPHIPLALFIGIPILMSAMNIFEGEYLGRRKQIAGLGLHA